jgi:hypothetical protein
MTPPEIDAALDPLTLTSACDPERRFYCGSMSCTAGAGSEQPSPLLITSLSQLSEPTG